MLLLWQFWVYSFAGFILETVFAAVTRSPHQNRRCFLMMPLCPVYGFGVLAVLSLPESLINTFWGLAIWGGLAATAVEYVVHAVYEKLLGVRFWDYSDVFGNLKGRICLPFSAAWGFLLAVVLPPFHQWLVPLLGLIPPPVTWWMVVLFTADALLTIWVLRETGDPEAIRNKLT